jgi:YggT family protein
MQALLWLIHTVIDLYIYIVIFAAIMSLLAAFNVVNTQNRFVYMVGDFLYRATDPVLRPMRKVIPNMGGLDFSPLVLILALVFLKRLLWEYLG